MDLTDKIFLAAFWNCGRRPNIVCEVGRMLICCTGAGTHNFQIASERLQYRMNRHELKSILLAASFGPISLS